MNKFVLSVKKHSPEILVVSGVVGVVASAVMACRATLKVKDVVDQKNDDMELMQEQLVGEADEHEIKKQTTHIYARAGLKVARLYAPAVGLGVLSLGCILESNHILRKRNAALAAAYAAVDSSFKLYRSRVVERYGEEVDYQIQHGVKQEEIQTEETDENGKTKKVKKKVDIVDPNGQSIYVKYFTRTNKNWIPDQVHMEYFFTALQNSFNDQLRIKKFLTLNEVYKELGFEETKAGMVVGWIYDDKNPDGDNFIQLDVHKAYLPNDRGVYEEVYVIDFNVDGNIYDRMA